MKEGVRRRWVSSGFCVKALGKSFRVVSAGRDLHLPSKNVPAEEMLKRTHTHFTYELLFAEQCEMTLVTEHSIHIYQNSVVIVPPGLKHCSMLKTRGGYSLLVLPQFEIGGEAKLPIDAPIAMELDADVGFYIRQLSLVWEDETQGAIAEHLAAILLHRIFSPLLGEEVENLRESKNEISPIGMIESYINGNYERNVTLADLSSVVHLCEKQVARIIKREYGVTLTRLLSEKRVGAAEMLLKNTDMKISEIAAKVSPTAENYFYTTFREHTGMSPLQYRKIYRRNETE